MKKRGFREVREREDKEERENPKNFKTNFLSLGFCPKHQIIQFGLSPSEYLSFTKFDRAKTNFYKYLTHNNKMK